MLSRPALSFWSLEHAFLMCSQGNQEFWKTLKDGRPQNWDSLPSILEKMCLRALFKRSSMSTFWFLVWHYLSSFVQEWQNSTITMQRSCWCTSLPREGIWMWTSSLSTMFTVWYTWHQMQIFMAVLMSAVLSLLRITSAEIFFLSF